MLTERQRHKLLFCHAFTGCDTISAIAGHGKSALFDKFCSGDIDKYMDIFLDLQATKDEVIRSGIAIFTMHQELLWEKSDTTCLPVRQQLD